MTTHPAAEGISEDESTVDPRLGQWLYRLRHTIDHRDLGLPTLPRRRSPWLTQTELARLAGLTPRAYQGVEQGHRRPGPRVLAGVAQALRLNQAQRAHLHRLANVPHARPTIPLHPEQVNRIVTECRLPAVAYDPAWAILAHNRPFQDLLPGLADPGANWLTWHFTSAQARQCVIDWEHEATELIARTRAIHGFYRDTTLIDSTLGTLSRLSPLARQLWTTGVDVAIEPASKTYRLCPTRGPQRDLCLVQLQPTGAGDPSLRIAVLLDRLPSSGSGTDPLPPLQRK